MDSIDPLTLSFERLQTRENTNSDYVDELASHYKEGESLPAITIFTDGNKNWLADGVHRVDAAIKVGANILVTFVTGTRADAIRFACGANVSHGLRRTNADKRRSVRLAIEEFPKLSSRAIADICHVAHHLVEEIRNDNPTGSSPSRSKNNGKTRVGKDGKHRDVSSNGGCGSKRAGVQKSTLPSSEATADEPTALRAFGEGDALDEVAEDLQEAIDAIRAAAKLVKKALRFENKQITRPYCCQFSLITIHEPLLHVARSIETDMPVGGTPKRPILFHEQKVKELA